MQQPTYEQKLARAAFDARIHDDFTATATLNKMIAAVAKESLHELGALHAMLPPKYREMVGPVPRAREDRS